MKCRLVTTTNLVMKHNDKFTNQMQTKNTCWRNNMNKTQMNNINKPKKEPVSLRR